MIIINFWMESGNSFDDREYSLELEAIVNDSWKIGNDEQLLFDCLDNHDFDPSLEHETLYELTFDRATIDADPIPESAFALTNIRARKVSDDGQFLDVIRM